MLLLLNITRNYCLIGMIQEVLNDHEIIYSAVIMLYYSNISIQLISKKACDVNVIFIQDIKGQWR